MTKLSSALVLFSGGQDSTTCLASALKRFRHVETIGFDYGQRHKVELSCRDNVLKAIRSDFPQWADRLGQDHMIDLGLLGEISETALTREAEIEEGEDGLPNTFVPGRNLIFLTVAGALAWRRGISLLVGGMCETDYSGYPDCRRETIDAQQKALALGMDKAISIETPLMWLDKAETWQLAEDLGGQALIDIIVKDTHTCYLGERLHRHDWGYGCGSCPACELRAAGYRKWRKGLTP
ncbi:7-cyano-7-deazaguanine synthase QueC [Henriciella aquimarina]|uniref:7-cyano-7-deazaguanine synthase QueC n=1 Tax=Henriciella aquimarina TaxID=545261 RepID=UPI0009FD8D53|nr:7-cyano-7-deazaguanine synthase QueC [Henriciella aquimarina]